MIEREHLYLLAARKNFFRYTFQRARSIYSLDYKATREKTKKIIYYKNTRSLLFMTASRRLNFEQTIPEDIPYYEKYGKRYISDLVIDIFIKVLNQMISDVLNKGYIIDFKYNKHSKKCDFGLFAVKEMREERYKHHGLTFAFSLKNRPLQPVQVSFYWKQALKETIVHNKIKITKRFKFSEYSKFIVKNYPEFTTRQASNLLIILGRGISTSLYAKQNLAFKGDAFGFHTYFKKTKREAIVDLFRTPRNYALELSYVIKNNSRRIIGTQRSGRVPKKEMDMSPANVLSFCMKVIREKCNRGLIQEAFKMNMIDAMGLAGRKKIKFFKINEDISTLLNDFFI